MSVPLLFTASTVHEFTDDQGWDALLLIAPTHLEGVPETLKIEIQNAKEVDQSIGDSVHLIHSSKVPGKRLIFCSVGTLLGECDDVRLFRDAASKGMQRAVQAGSHKPYIALFGV